ncbi:MAG: EpsI family protein [Colwellia sp.]|nr:EpsI family protein [Colwellia sp.]
MNDKIVKAIPIAAILIAWFYTYYQGVVTSINVWITSEIFNHCFLVIGGAFFLIYQKRIQLIQQPFIPNYWLFIPLIGTVILYTFGLVGDIRLFMHFATYVSLPLLIWLIVGNQAAKTILFPLYFILFAIPVGEQLIPYLQEFTTDLAVPLLEMSGVPIYRNGLYLDIPEGRFLVAEACSGISFLIASIVFGNIYAYLSFRTLPKQVLFVFISIVVPIIANALRVYGIILTAHLTDMEYAAGADHLIYGGVFYTIILFLLILIGERFRDKSINIKLPSQDNTQNSHKNLVSLPLVCLVIAVFVSQLLWLKSIENNRLAIKSAYIINTQSLFIKFDDRKTKKWQPSFPHANEVQQGSIKISQNTSIDIFIASYTAGTGELISSLNRLYDADRWTLINTKNIKIKGSEQQAQITQLVSPHGEKRIIVHWYQISDKFFSNKVKAKLFQTVNSLLGRENNNALVAFSLQASSNTVSAEQELMEFIEKNAEKFNQIMQSK